MKKKAEAQEVALAGDAGDRAVIREERVAIAAHPGNLLPEHSELRIDPYAFSLFAASRVGRKTGRAASLVFDIRQPPSFRAAGFAAFQEHRGTVPLLPRRQPHLVPRGYDPMEPSGR